MDAAGLDTDRLTSIFGGMPAAVAVRRRLRVLVERILRTELGRAGDGPGTTFSFDLPAAI